MKKEPKINRFIQDLVNDDKEKSKGKLTVFLICLGISVFLWFLIELSNESLTSLEYPIEYINTPADMVLVNRPDSLLTFRVSSGGLELLTLRYLTRKKPVVINLAQLDLEEREEFYLGSFNTSRLTSELIKEYNFSEELVSISPTSINFIFESLSGKMVPVVSALKLSFQKQYRLSDSIRFSPSEVKVVGPRNLIDELESVSTVEDEVENIGGAVSSVVALEDPLPNVEVRLVPDQVEYRIVADKYTESEIELPVLVADPGVNVKTFPEKVRVTFLVSLDNYSRIDPELFLVTIRLPQESNGKIKAAVEVSLAPEFVEVTKIEPAEVDFLVLKK